MRQIHAPEAWAVTTGTRDVIVAVIDGGVDIDHPDLKDNIWTNSKEIPGDGVDNDHDAYVDDVHGWNFVTDSPDVRPVFKATQYEDAWSHGTMVASLIAARGNNGIGMAGMAWNARIMPLVVLDADGEGDTENIAKAIRYAVSHGAKVINMSLVGYDYDQDLDLLIRNAAAAGVVMVAATGNDDSLKSGIDIDQAPAYPVCMDAGHNVVIGVSGTDTVDQKAPYANYGKLCTDISAPAQELFAARPSYPHDVGHVSSTVPNYVDQVTGTSLAAPLVSGTAALLWSVRPDWTAEQIRRRIIKTADPIEAMLTDEQKGRLGAGRLNAGRALADVMALAADGSAKPRYSVRASVTSGSVVLTDILNHTTSTWQPYGPVYKAGIQSLDLGGGYWLFWPRQGGGHAVVLGPDGRVAYNNFPLGKQLLGNWLVEHLKTGDIAVKKPGGSSVKLRWQEEKLSVLP